MAQVKLDEKRKRVAELRHALAIAEGEARGWEDAIRLLTSVAPIASAEQRSETVTIINPAAIRHAAGLGKSSGLRGLSEHWKRIFAGIASYHPEAATLDDILSIADRLGTPINRNTLRSQASIYAEKGILERVGQGSYRVTPSGAEQLGATLPKEPDPVGELVEIEAASPVQEDAAQS